MIQRIPPSSAVIKDALPGESVSQESSKHSVDTTFGIPHDFSRIPIRLQKKSIITEPGDQCEQEADQVAEQVMRLPGAGPVKSLMTPRSQSQPYNIRTPMRRPSIIMTSPEKISCLKTQDIIEFFQGEKGLGDFKFKPNYESGDDQRTPQEEMDEQRKKQEKDEIEWKDKPKDDDQKRRENQGRNAPGGDPFTNAIERGRKEVEERKRREEKMKKMKKEIERLKKEERLRREDQPTPHPNNQDVA